MTTRLCTTAAARTDHRRANRGPTRHTTRRTLAAVITTAALTVLMAACGASPPPAGSGSSPRAGGSSSSPSLAAFSACMRSHGVPNFPDPDSKGNPPPADPEVLGVGPAQYQAAEQACLHLLPTGGSLQQQTQQCLLFGDCPQALLQQLLTVERQYAQCMRSHGFPNFPDPAVGAKGRPVFDLTAAGMDPHNTDSSQFRSNDRECRSRIGGSVPSLPVS